jgi:hypothetical protein
LGSIGPPHSHTSFLFAVSAAQQRGIITTLFSSPTQQQGRGDRRLVGLGDRRISLSQKEKGDRRISLSKKKKETGGRHARWRCPVLLCSLPTASAAKFAFVPPQATAVFRRVLLRLQVSRGCARGGCAAARRRGGMEYRDKLVLAPMVRVVTPLDPSSSHESVVWNYLLVRI